MLSDVGTMVVVQCSLKLWRGAVCWIWGQGQGWIALCSASWWDLMAMWLESTWPQSRSAWPIAKHRLLHIKFLIFHQRSFLGTHYFQHHYQCILCTVILSPKTITHFSGFLVGCCINKEKDNLSWKKITQKSTYVWNDFRHSLWPNQQGIYQDIKSTAQH